MRLDYLSIFPAYFDVLDISLLGKAAVNGLVEVHAHDLRDWTHDRHRTVDDTPCGGGAGMVMKPDPWGEAFDEIIGTEPDSSVHVIFPSPSGAPFDPVCCSRVVVGGADRVLLRTVRGDRPPRDRLCAVDVDCS